MALFKQLSQTGQTQFLGLVQNRDETIASAPVESVNVTYGGFEGNYHSGETFKSGPTTSQVYAPGTLIHNARQISILSTEDLEQIAEKMSIAPIDPCLTGANIVLSGIPHLSLLPGSTRLRFSSGATLVVDMINYPCRNLAAMLPAPADGHPGVIAAARYHRGILCRVEQEGRITSNDSVDVFIPAQPPYPA